MCKNLNNVPFLCTKLFQKRGHYSSGDIILRKYGIPKNHCILLIDLMSSRQKLCIILENKMFENPQKGKNILVIFKQR